MGNNTVFSFATLVVNPDQHGKFPYLVTFYNVQTKRPVQIPMDIDTGGHATQIGVQYAETLGVDLKRGKQFKSYGIGGVVVTQYIHKIPMKLGNLKPILVPVLISSQRMNTNLLGWSDVLNRYRLEVTRGNLRISEVESALGMLIR